MRQKFLFLLIFSILKSYFLVAQGNFTSQASNNWSSTLTWTLNSGSDADGIPDADDNVTLATTFTVGVDVNSACNNITINGTGVLDFPTNNRTLIVNGTFTMNGTSQVTGNANTRILSLLGNFIVPAGQSGSIAGIQVAQTSSMNFTVSGTFNPSDNTGTKNLGNLIINASGRWNSTSGEIYNVQNCTLTDGASIDGSSTATINILGNLIINPGVPGNKTAIDRITINVTGTCTINGYLLFARSNSGTKTFNNTITVIPAGTWDNIVGEDPVVNCNIVNNGYWPEPTGGTGTYNINIAGSYTYSGLGEISMTQLRFQSTSTLTNLGRLLLTKTNNQGLLINNGGSFINGNGGYLKLTSNATPIVLNGGSTVNFTTALNTVEYAYAGNQNVFTTTYNKLTCSNGGIKTVAGLTTIDESITIQDNTIVDVSGGTDLLGAGDLIMTGTSELDLSTAGTIPELTGSAHSLAAGTTINFYRAGAQTAASSANYPYQNVVISGNAGSAVNMSNVSLIQGDLVFINNGVMTNNAVLTVNGTFNFGGTTGTTTLANNITVGNFIASGGGTLNYSSRIITINQNDGTWTFNGGTTFTTNGTSQVVFTSGTNQQITGSSASTFRNLTIDNNNGVTLSSTSATISGAPSSLTLTNGGLITGSNVVIMSIGSTVSRTNGFVDGNFQKPVAIGIPITILYEVGTGSNYSPVTVRFASVTASGNLRCTAISGDHPDINGSNVEPNRSINRYWSLLNTGITFTTYLATFNFVASDFDPLADWTNFQVKRNDGLNWYATTLNARTSTSTQFTGEIPANLPSGSPQDFQVGELINTTGVYNRLTGAVNWNSIDTWIQNKTGNAQFTNGSNLVTGAGTLFSSELTAGDVLMLQTSPGTVRGTIQSITDDNNLTLSSNATATASGGYGRKYIPNTNGDQVTIGNSNIADLATTITLNMNATVNSLDINTSASPKTTAQILTHSGANSLTVQTNVKINQPGGNTSDIWNINAGSATVNGNLTIGTLLNNVNEISRINITSGTLTVGTNLIFNTANTNGLELTSVIDMSGGSGRLNLGKSILFTNNRGLLLPGSAGSIFNFARSASGQSVSYPSSNQVANPWIYNNIYANNTSIAGLNVPTAITSTNVTGDIRIQSGTFVITNNAVAGNAAKTFQVSSGALLILNGTRIVPGGFGTIDLGTTTPFGTVQYQNTGGVNISNLNYGKLDILSDPNTFTLPAGALNIAGNLTIGNGINTPVLIGNGGGSILNVTGNIIINTGGEINAANITTINVGGNWYNDGLFSQSTRTVVFNATGPSQPQTMSGSSSDIFYNLTINTTATTNTIQLLKDIVVSQTLTLTKGGIDLNGHILSVTRANTAAISRTNGFVKSETNSLPYGELSWTTGTATGSFTFPFAFSSTQYIPVIMNITVAGSPASGSFSIATYHTPNDNTPYPSGVTNLYPGDNSANVVDRFWIITPNNYTTTRPTSTITITATSAETGTITNLQAQRWSPSNNWDPPFGGQTNTDSSATVSGINSYSPWTLSGNNSPLPVTVISFDATTKENTVELSWVTIKEINNDYFTIERSSDGIHYEDILTIKGAGNSSRIKKYSITDFSPGTGRSYYRLKQTDFNGRSTSSQVIVVEIAEVDLENTFVLFPNPSSGYSINIRCSENETREEVKIGINDSNGRLIYNSIPVSGFDGIISLELSKKLDPGLYVISITYRNRTHLKKLIVR